MKAENLLDAIGNLDDSVLIEYDNLSNGYVNKKYGYIKWLAVAACLFIVLTSGIYFLSGPAEKEPTKLGDNRKPPVNTFVPGATESEAPLHSAAPTEGAEVTPSDPSGTATPIIRPHAVSEAPGRTPESPEITQGPKRPQTGQVAQGRPEKTQAPERPKTTETVPEKPATTSDVPKPTATSPPNATEEPEETDWESMWAYFIARLESEKGEGIYAGTTVIPSTPSDPPPWEATESPSNPEPWGTAGTETPPEEALGDPSMSDEYFIENSYWTFEFDYAGGHYIARKSALSESNLERYLGKIDLHIYERALKGLHFQKKLSAYSIKNVSMQAVIAVCVEPGEYYLFVNTDYAPDSLQAFLTDFDLISTADLTRIAIYKTGVGDRIYSISEPMETKIWDTLLSYDSPVTSGSVPESRARVKIEMKNDFYSYYNVVFYLHDEGYLSFDVLGHQFTFRGNKEMIDRIISYYPSQ